MTYTYMTFSSVVYTVPNRTVVLKILKKREKKVRTINRTCTLHSCYSTNTCQYQGTCGTTRWPGLNNTDLPEGIQVHIIY